jgi:ketosteroid isomerase-like protein
VLSDVNIETCTALNARENEGHEHGLQVRHNPVVASDGAMNDQPAVIRTLLDYYAAFNTFEVEAVLPYFHEPSLLMGPQGALAAPTHNVLATVFRTAIDSLRARGFGRSELSVRRVESLSPSANLVTGVAIRYTVDGQELERVGVTYVLHNADSRWKIAVLIVHDPNDAALTE